MIVSTCVQGAIIYCLFCMVQLSFECQLFIAFCITHLSHKLQSRCDALVVQSNAYNRPNQDNANVVL